MSQDFNPERERFGSASFADARDIERAGLFEQTPESVFLGFHDQRALYHNGMAGQVIVGGARSGKLRDLLAYSVCPGVHFGTALIVDPKGELAAISRNQVIAKKHCVYWNPAGLHGLPRTASTRPDIS